MYKLVDYAYQLFSILNNNFKSPICNIMFTFSIVYFDQMVHILPKSKLMNT